MKHKIIALLLCFVCVFSLCFPVAADDDGYSAIVSDIDKTCPTCGATLHASWVSTSGAEVELEISDTGKVKIPAGAGAFARIHLRCSSCGYEKTETRLLGLDFGAEKPGKLVQAPSGIGRKDLPGYADDDGTPSITQTGILHLSIEPLGLGWGTDRVNGFTATNTFKYMQNGMSGEGIDIPTDGSTKLNNAGPIYKIVAPVNGIYRVNKALSPNTHFKFWQWRAYSGGFWSEDDYNVFNIVSTTSHSVTLKAGQEYYFRFDYGSMSVPYKYQLYNLDLYIEPIADANIVKNTTITINNNTWNGNIYTDNSTNLTYIYPQYTTINEKNETVTNISNTPIIYNNETKQYYTYDQTTKNYYYITYNSDPAPSPTPTPAPADKLGGSISTPETGKPGNSSGSSWWDKLLSKIGDAIIDGLLGAVSAVLKLIFKLLSTILSWIIWAVSRVFDLLPFLPPGLGGLLVGGVVVCFVIGIIKFIRG